MTGLALETDEEVVAHLRSGEGRLSWGQLMFLVQKLSCAKEDRLLAMDKIVELDASAASILGWLDLLTTVEDTSEILDKETQLTYRTEIGRKVLEKDPDLEVLHIVYNYVPNLEGEIWTHCSTHSKEPEYFIALMQRFPQFAERVITELKKQNPSDDVWLQVAENVPQEATAFLVETILSLRPKRRHWLF